MAGILNNKQRIMDAIFTVEGRRQMANGTIRLSFASFTDEGLFYDSDDGVHVREIMDPGFIVLEAVSLPKDVIVPEVDDSGAFSITNSDNSKIVNGRQIISGSSDFQTGSLSVYSGSASTMQSAVQHFDWNQIIGTVDALYEEDKSFKCHKNTVNLSTDLANSALRVHVSNLRPMLFDSSLSHMKNLKYLPPQYEENNTMRPLGNYPKITSEDHSTFDTFAITELLPSISKDNVRFVKTSEANNLIGQCFEIGPTGVKKLIIIDYGEYVEGGEIVGRIFYLGKIVRDSAGTPRFIRLFTLVFK